MWCGCDIGRYGGKVINNTKFRELRQRAENLLLKRGKKQLVDQDIYQVVEELNLYQIELEIQNEDLIKAQMELQVSHDKYAVLYNLAPIAYFTCNCEGLIIDVNQAGLYLLGMQKNVLINRCFSRYIVPEFQLLFSQFRKMVLTESSSHVCELKLLRWSGPSFDARLECRAIQDINSVEMQFLMCVKDITDRKKSEKSMHLRQVKMASIDRMRSMNEQIFSIANNQNHSLAVLDNYIYGCIRRLESDKFNADDLLNILKKVAQQSRILANIILQMKSFSSKTIFRYESANINTIIKEILSLIDYEILEFPIKIHYEEVDGFPAMKIDKLHIQQVILNLARNSIEAMRDASIGEPKLLIEVRQLNQNVIEITMLDNGPGFEPSIAHKLFDPHFTTKSYAMGLGLTVSRTIVEKHGGQLIAQMNSAGGASFQLSLPCVAIANQ